MKRFFLRAFTVFITLLMIILPQKSIYYSKQALDMCYEIIIPSLFPFFVCSGILIYSGFAETVSRLFRPVMKPLFNVNENGSAAFVLGIISGYPLGAITACNLYESSYLSKSEAERLLAFCNNSGPLFIMGAVGSAIYSNPGIGIILYAAHIISALLVGISFRFYEKDKFPAPPSRLSVHDSTPSQIFSTVLSNSLNSILTVCGSILLFFSASSLILELLPVNSFFNAVISSIFEFTGGIKKISALNAALPFRLTLSSFAVGFAGFCVHMQVMSVTAKYGLSLKPYILGKILHGSFSAIITYILLCLFPRSIEVFSPGTAGISGGFCFSSIYLVIASASLFALSSVLVFFTKCQRKEKSDPHLT